MMLTTVKTQRFGIAPHLNSRANAVKPYFINISNDAGIILKEAGIGMWSLQAGSTVFQLCPTFRKLMQLNEGIDYTFLKLVSLVCSSSRPDFVSALKAACQTGVINVDFKITESHIADEKWFRLTGKAYPCHDNDKPTYMGTLTDITATKKAELWNNDRLALLSHELRGPLSVIKLYLQRAAMIAAENKFDDASLFLNKADEQVNTMTGMMDDFLGEAALAQSGLQLNFNWFNMRSLVNDIITEVSARFASHCFVINVPSSISLKADKAKIKQVIINYVTNAVKYAPEGSQIKIKCRKTSKEIQFSVADQGCGIAPEHVSKVFDRYYRVPQTKAKGFGLGLYLVKNIINQHGGKVWAESVLNEGSTFYFSLPVAVNTIKN